MVLPCRVGVGVGALTEAVEDVIDHAAPPGVILSMKKSRVGGGVILKAAAVTGAAGRFRDCWLHVGREGSTVGMGAVAVLATAGGAAGGGGSAMVLTFYDGQSILLFTFPAMQTNFF